MMQKNINIPQLTGLRFVAAFYVFLYHVLLRLEYPFEYLRVKAIFSNGATGVNLFFILSGLILYYNYRNKNISYREFIIKRLAKIYPVYCVGFLLSLGVYVYFDKDLYSIIDVILLNLGMIQSYFPAKSMIWYGGGSWSISTEFFFYMLFPFLLLMIRNITKIKALVGLGFCYFFSFIFGIVYHLGGISFEFNYVFPLLRISEFVIGILFGVLLFEYTIKVKKRYLMLVLLFCVLFFFAIGYKLQGITVQNIVIVPIVGIVFYMILSVKSKGLSFLGSPLMVYLGKVSYSFYIVQIPIMLYLGNETVLKELNSYYNFFDTYCHGLFGVSLHRNTFS